MSGLTQFDGTMGTEMPMMDDFDRMYTDLAGDDGLVGKEALGEFLAYEDPEMDVEEVFQGFDWSGDGKLDRSEGRAAYDHYTADDWEEDWEGDLWEDDWEGDWDHDDEWDWEGDLWEDDW